MFDNPDLIVACVIGDGEAETGPLATAWHSNKFLNPITDGTVLPILHPHGLSDDDFDALFTKDKPIVFAFHGYPWHIHRLTYHRTNHDNMHVRGYKEEGTITTTFDMTVLNDLDRFHLVLDVLHRLPHEGAPASPSNRL